MATALSIIVPIGLFELAVVALMVVVYRTMAAEERAVRAREVEEGARHRAA